MNLAEKEIRKEFNKIMRETIKYFNHKRAFDSLCNDYYGENCYSDTDDDEIIDALDYGLGGIDFKTFDASMKKANKKGKELME